LGRLVIGPEGCSADNLHLSIGEIEQADLTGWVRPVVPEQQNL
jgi:hypothetical protein